MSRGYSSWKNKTKQNKTEVTDSMPTTRAKPFFSKSEMFSTAYWLFPSGPVVRKVDNVIYLINHFSVDSAFFQQLSIWWRLSKARYRGLWRVVSTIVPLGKRSPCSQNKLRKRKITYQAAFDFNLLSPETQETEPILFFKGEGMKLEHMS